MRRETDPEPLHSWFSLSYANYLVLHRSLLQEMSVAWQRKMVALLDEFWDEFDSEKVPHSFTVNRRDEGGRFLADPLSQYRHPDRALIERLRKPKDEGKP